MSVLFSVHGMAQEPLQAKTVQAKTVQVESEVILFSAEWCGYCKKAKQFLNENDIKFTELDLDKSDDNIDRFEAAGGEGIPYLVVGEQKLAGFDKKDYVKVFRL